MHCPSCNQESGIDIGGKCLQCSCLHAFATRDQDKELVCDNCGKILTQYFTIALVRYVKDVDGGAARDDEFLPEQYDTLQRALRAVELMPSTSQYVIDDHPRTGMGPAWRGWGGIPD